MEELDRILGKSGRIMTKDVVVTIAGFQTLDDDDNAVEMVHIGEYYEKNGTHYIFFEERMDGMSEPVKNQMKIKEGYLGVQKRGPVSVDMVFETGKSQSSTYAIPFGSFLIETHTKKVKVTETKDRMEVTAEYEMEINGVYCAKSEIKVMIEEKERFRL